MICVNCGAKLNSDVIECPYCKCSIANSLRRRKAEDINLANRLKAIDDFYGIKINDDYINMSLREIERYYNTLINNYDHYGFQLSLERKLKIEEHIERVVEENQRRYPIRKEANIDENLYKFNSDFELVEFLLKKSTPPQIHAAAFKLRSSCERKLRDYYKFKYISYKNIHRFEKSYNEMFKIITKNNQVAVKLVEYHFLLNSFVHECKKNDLIISKKFGNIEKTKQFLVKVLEEHLKYNLI